MDSKEFKRDDEGCLNLQNRVTDVDYTKNSEFSDDSKDVEKLKDVLNDSEYTDDCPGYILALPLKNSQDSKIFEDNPNKFSDDMDDEEMEFYKAMGCDIEEDEQDNDEMREFVKFQFSDFYAYNVTVMQAIYSLKQREINKKRKEKLKEIAQIIKNMSTSSFKERKETMDIIIETFKQLMNFSRSYKFYLDELKNLKVILNDESLSKDLGKADMLEIKKRKKEIKRTLKTFLDDMADTVSTLLFDEEQYRMENLKSFNQNNNKGFNHP